MAAGAERQMNLAALQQRDPYITSIVDTASQVALYSFSSTSNEWEKTSVEGTLFVYCRSASPINGFMILNRLGLNDLIEPINKNLEFQLQDPFLLYRNEKASIFGIWFYDKDECARIGQLMNSLVQVASHTQENRDGRQRRASESDTMVDRTGSSSSVGSDAGGGGGGSTGGGGGGLGGPILRGAVVGPGNVDILQMLSKALDEYDKGKPGAMLPGLRKTEPKPLIDNPNASATTLSDLIRPRPVKFNTGLGASTGDEDHGAASSGATAGASGAPEPAPSGANVNTLEKLFRQASLHKDSTSRPNVSVAPPGGPPTGQLPPILQRLMSNPGATVAEIERQQRGEIPRDQMPEPVGEEAPPGGIGINGVKPAAMLKDFTNEEPDSPNTALKRSLNILPPASSVSTSRSQITHDSLLRTSTAPALFSSQISTSSIVKSSSAEPSSRLSTSNPVSSSQLSSHHQPQFTQRHPLEMFEPEIFMTKTVSSDVVLAGQGAVATVRQTSRIDSETLVTPQSLLQSATASLPPSVSSQGNSSQLTQAASILLSPMMFQTSNLGHQPPAAHTLQHQGCDMFGLKSTSPQDPNLDLLCRLPHTPPAPSPTTMSHNITPLTRDQLQQAMVYLLQNDNQFVATLHDAYVKSLNLATRGPGSDRS